MSLSDEPRDYHLNLDAAEELVRQTTRVSQILERLAAHLAAKDLPQDNSLLSLVEARHVSLAGELVLGSVGPIEAVQNHCVFVSFSHEDEAFVSELGGRLELAGISFFKSNRDIRPSSDWAESNWNAIRSCCVFVSVLTTRFLNSQWCNLEGGAACASKKVVLPVLRYVKLQEAGPIRPISIACR